MKPQVNPKHTQNKAEPFPNPPTPADAKGGASRITSFCLRSSNNNNNNNNNNNKTLKLMALDSNEHKHPDTRPDWNNGGTQAQRCYHDGSKRKT